MQALLIVASLLAAGAVDANPFHDLMRRRTRPTTAAPTSSSSYAASVLADFEAAVAAGTCISRAYSECSGSCAGDVDSVYLEFTDGDWRYIIVNGVPDHTSNEGAVAPNNNDACENRAYLKVPLSPSISGYSASDMGPVGLAVTGAFVFNHLSSPSGSDDVAVLNEGASFDNCDGHSTGGCIYHYHDNPTCLADTSDCPLVGYMLDGIALYGYCTVDGQQLRSCYSQTSGDGYTSTDYEWADKDDCELDYNNGYTFADGSYGYVISDSYPYTPTGYMATSYSLCYF